MASINVHRFTGCFPQIGGPKASLKASLAARLWPKRTDLVPVLIGSCVCSLSARQPGRRCRIGWKLAVASSRMELLVDGDVFSIDIIRSAISSLEQDGRHKVRTTLFVQPGRLLNKSWAKFGREPGITIRAVHRRSVELGREPADEAIEKAMRKMSGSSAVGLALMTMDTGFLAPIVELQDQGSSITVLTEKNRFGVISTYQDAGVKVVGLQLLRDKSPKVSALLYPDGTSSVQLGTRFQEPFYETYIAQARRVMELMEDLGYRQGERSFFATECAKFWCANGSGPLTVWPEKAVIARVHDLVTQQSRGSWQHNDDKLAYFLPITKPSRTTPNQLKTYGSELARAVFKGGGPFILNDSPDLTADALTKLGFLDDTLNADVAEAMYVFVNVARNKAALRKMGMLPDFDDRCLDVNRKLRQAFRSTESPGSWQVMMNKASSKSPLVSILKRAKILPATADFQYSSQELFEAMKVYAKQCNLPSARTFNCLRFRILRQTHGKDPSLRMDVDFDRS